MKQFNNLTIPVVFFGSSSYVIPILEVLRKNFSLSLVITTQKNPTDAVPSYCIKNKVPYLSASNLSDPSLKLKIKNLKLKIAVLADFGLIVPKTILDTFPMGIINVHPSLLPKYRGPTPVQTSILNGDKTTGVSIVKLDEEIDHGPILGQEKEKILDNDTSESLYERLFEIGANLLLKILNKYLEGSLKPTPQNHKEATFTKSLTRQSGFVDLSTFNSQLSILNLKRMIRAYFPWPGVWTRLHLGGGRLSLRSHDSSEVKEKIIKFLPGNLIQVEGKKPMSYKDFQNGYPEAKQIHSLLGQL